MATSDDLNPVRYYTENDAYHYTVDNRPLQDLESNDEILAEAIDTLALRVTAFTGEGWSPISPGGADTSLTFSSPYAALNAAGPISVTDFIYTGTASGIVNITFRNAGTNAITFVHNTAKLRNNSGANIVLNQHQSITYTWISGTAWQHTGGKQS